MSHSDTIHVDVHRCYCQDDRDTPQVVRSKKNGPGGVTRFTRAFSLCVLVIPILYVVGLVTELWFYYNPWGRAFITTRYIKAVLYIAVWFRLMHTCLPDLLAKTISAFFCCAGFGLAVTHEAVVRGWGISVFGGSEWNGFWLNVQWWYWGLLTLTYLYAWFKMAHGPRHWILKYGADEYTV